LGCEFTRRYKIKYLIYWENTENVWVALEREKEIKKWRREKKLALAQSLNPRMVDLSHQMLKDEGLGEVEIEEIIAELRLKYKQKGD
jgi:hypothetical protein